MSRRRPALAHALCAAALACAMPAARAADVLVGAASSLTQALRAVAPLFEASHPGTRVQFSFAASDTLVTQLDQGAPLDVLACADESSMDRAQSRGLLAAGSRRVVVRNALVLVVPATAATGEASAPPLRALPDLAGPSVRHVALGQPSGVPAGRYAKAVLENARLWEAVSPKAVYGQNVRQALDFVARGEAEAGFVYATDAAIEPGVHVAFPVATATPVTYPAALAARAPHPADARAFLDFLATPAAQAVFARLGFQHP